MSIRGKIRLNKMPAHSPSLAEGQEGVKAQGDFPSLGSGHRPSSLEPSHWVARCHQSASAAPTDRVVMV